MSVDERQFLAEEHRVELQSSQLKRSLRLGDLILAQVLYIVGLQWFGTAGKVGSSHVVYWIPAVLLFYIPSGMVVVHLNREMPLEGGLYQWAKLRFGGFVGFLTAVNVWAAMLLILTSLVPAVTDNLAYLIGASGAWISDSNTIAASVAIAAMTSYAFMSLRGMDVAKWVHNIGGVSLLVLVGGMLAFAIPRWMSGTATVAPVSFVPPAMTLLNLNLLGKMGFGAFSGFDACAIFSAEVQDQDVARTIRKSVWIAAPLITLFYTLGTACVLAFSTPDKIDLISSSAQVLSLGASTYGMGVWPATLGAAVLILGTVCSGSLYFNALVRLPMVAGWDRLVPETMSRLHQRYKTPAGSIVIVAVLGIGLSIAGHSGVGSQEAFQLINSAGMVCWGLAYMSMFAIPLLAPGERPSWGIRIAAISGFAMTLLSAVLGLFPILDVASVGAFAAKVGGVVVAINALAAWHYKRVTNHTAPAMEIKTDA